MRHRQLSRLGSLARTEHAQGGGTADAYAPRGIGPPLARDAMPREVEAPGQAEAAVQVAAGEVEVERDHTQAPEGGLGRRGGHDRGLPHSSATRAKHQDGSGGTLRCRALRTRRRGGEGHGSGQRARTPIRRAPARLSARPLPQLLEVDDEVYARSCGARPQGSRHARRRQDHAPRVAVMGKRRREVHVRDAIRRGPHDDAELAGCGLENRPAQTVGAGRKLEPRRGIKGQAGTGHVRAARLAAEGNPVIHAPSPFALSAETTVGAVLDSPESPVTSSAGRARRRLP